MLFRKEDAIQKEYFFDEDSTEFVQVHQRGGFSGGGRGWFLGIQGETYEEGNFKKEGEGERKSPGFSPVMHFPPTSPAFPIFFFPLAPEIESR